MAFALLRRLLELLRDGWLAVLERVAAFLDRVHRWIDERLLAAGGGAAGEEARRPAPVPVSSLSAPAKRRLAAYCLALREPYDRENPEHGRRLEAFWSVEAVQTVLSKERCNEGSNGGSESGGAANRARESEGEAEEGEGAQVGSDEAAGPRASAAASTGVSTASEALDVPVPALPPSRRHALWKALGWQSDDPARDFRASGLLSLQALTWFARERPDEFVRLACKRTGRRTEWEYPFATAGVGLTVEVAAIGGVLGAGAALENEDETAAVEGRLGTVVGTRGVGVGAGSKPASSVVASPCSSRSPSSSVTVVAVHGLPASPHVSPLSRIVSSSRTSPVVLLARFVAVPVKLLGAAAAFLAHSVTGPGSRGRKRSATALSGGLPLVVPPPPAHVTAGLRRLLESSGSAFEELLAASLVLLDQVWLERGASYLEFGPVFSETRERVGKLLDDPNLSVERLRNVGREFVAEAGQTEDAHEETRRT